MANTFFKFKQFTIHQQNAAMKVGTDGVLLGAWAQCINAQQILDIGTGTGLIALMLAQRSTASIDGVEIDQSAYLDACNNVENSIWRNRISIYNTAIQNFNPDKKYDLIVSNPPFFSKSLKAGTLERTKARHDDGLSISDLFNTVNRLIDTKGLFCVVIPTDNHDNYVKEASLNGLHCSKKLSIKPTPTKASKRVLLEFTRNPLKISETEIIVEDKGRHQYSEEYIALTKEYYLNF